MAKKKSVSPRRSKTLAYEVDIGQEFKDVKQAIFSLKDDLNEWKSIFNTQLDKLNTNMEHVLSKIADHEGRITKLETDSLKSETKKQTISELSKFGWWAAKLLLGAGIIIGSVLGTAQAWKIVFPG